MNQLRKRTRTENRALNPDATGQLSSDAPLCKTGSNKRGRPATERGAYNPNPARQLGRVSDEDWAELKAAAEAAGKSFTEWALPALLAKARRERKK